MRKSRLATFTEGKSLGSPEFAEAFYDEHIARGRTGEEREEHKERWVYDFSPGGLAAVHFRGKGVFGGGSP